VVLVETRREDDSVPKIGLTLLSIALNSKSEFELASESPSRSSMPFLFDMVDKCGSQSYGALGNSDGPDKNK